MEEMNETRWGVNELKMKVTFYFKCTRCYFVSLSFIPLLGYLFTPRRVEISCSFLFEALSFRNFLVIRVTYWSCQKYVLHRRFLPQRRLRFLVKQFFFDETTCTLLLDETIFQLYEQNIVHFVGFWSVDLNFLDYSSLCCVADARYQTSVSCHIFMNLSICISREFHSREMFYCTGCSIIGLVFALHRHRRDTPNLDPDGSSLSHRSTVRVQVSISLRPRLQSCIPTSAPFVSPGKRPTRMYAHFNDPCRVPADT